MNLAGHYGEANGFRKDNNVLAHRFKLVVLTLSLASLSPAQARFSTPINSSTGGTYPHCAATGDFNRDGKLDVAVVNRDSDTVAILLANGPGTFRAPIVYSVDVGTFPNAIVAADFNDDGKLDLAVTNGLTGNVGGSVTVLLGNGDGTLRKLAPVTTTNSPMSVAAGDLNRDGRADLFIGGNGSASVMLGKGDGTFQAAVMYNDGPVGTAPAVALGDFNGDKILDAATANMFDNKVGILLGNGDGTLKPYTDFPVLNTPVGVVVADLNRDGKLDVAIADHDSDSVSVLLGNGDGTFGLASTYYAGTGPNWVASADFNGDKKLDLVFPDLTGTGVTFEFGKGDGTLDYAGEFPSGSVPYFALVGDFNRDGAPDVATTNAKGNTLSVLLNMAGTFVTTTSSRNPSLISQPVTFTTKVRASVSGPLTPTGTVTFKDGSSTLGTAALVSGSASITTSTLTVGSHTIHPIYSGDGNFNPKTGSSLSQLVTEVVLTPTSITFGSQALSTTSSAKSVTLVNKGSSALSISSISILGTNAADFTKTTSCGTSVASGASCTISISFKPSGSGNRTASLSIADNGGASPQKVPLAGTGI